MNEAKVLKSSLLSFPHGFSTRIGGVSEGIYDSLNLGMNRGDEIEKVKENWSRFLKACNINQETFVCGAQVHGTYVHIATKENLRPAYGPGEMVQADGYVTKEKNVPISIFTADCVPVLLEDSENKVIGAVHAGWRSAVGDIEKEAIDKMLFLGATTDSIHIAIGPAIDKCCFEVGEEVIVEINKLLSISSFEQSNAFYTKKSNGKYMLDLRGAVKERFLQLGISENNIEIVGECTMCHPKYFWSHRYTNGVRGSQASIISM